MLGVENQFLAFNFYHELNIKEARELIVYATELFLKIINTDKDIRPHLRYFPFNEKNIEIDFYIYHPDGHSLSPDKISLVSIRSGVITYALEFPDQKGTPRPILLQETYQEALQKINNENQT